MSSRKRFMLAFAGYRTPQGAPDTHSRAHQTSAFTLSDLLVVISILAVLAILVVPALGNAKVNSRQMSCLNNLRQLGIASRMYVVDFQQFTGSYSPAGYAYVWPTRLFGYADGRRSLFSCPAAVQSSRWDTNFNKSLGGGKTPSGAPDPWSVTPKTCFSYAINDWGISTSVSPQLGLGGDVDGGFARGPVRDENVVAPSQMIMIADAQAQASAGVDQWEANLDPTQVSQWPSNRHLYQSDVLFTDGHTETPVRPDVVNPASSWRRRWNNDNSPHNELASWVYTAAQANVLDPSY